MLDDKTINSLITDKPQKHLTIFDLLSDINLNYNLTYNTFTLNETKTLKSYFKKSIQKLYEFEYWEARIPTPKRVLDRRKAVRNRYIRLFNNLRNDIPLTKKETFWLVKDIWRTYVGDIYTTLLAYPHICTSAGEKTFFNLFNLRSILIKYGVTEEEAQRSNLVRDRLYNKASELTTYNTIYEYEEMPEFIEEIKEGDENITYNVYTILDFIYDKYKREHDAYECLRYKRKF